jgi:hypothetical protein
MPKAIKDYKVKEKVNNCGGGGINKIYKAHCDRSSADTSRAM